MTSNQQATSVVAHSIFSLLLVGVLSAPAHSNDSREGQLIVETAELLTQKSTRSWEHERSDYFLFLGSAEEICFRKLTFHYDRRSADIISQCDDDSPSRNIISVKWELNMNLYDEMVLTFTHNDLSPPNDSFVVITQTTDDREFLSLYEFPEDVNEDALEHVFSSPR